MLLSSFDSAGHSTTGPNRTVNEDQYLVAELTKTMTIHSSTLPVDEDTEFFSGLRGQLLVVADGFSGEPGGEVAGQIGVGITARYVLNTMPWYFTLEHDRADDQRDALLSALTACERALEAEAASNPRYQTMGTTLTMAYIVWPRLFLVHVGDSRGYLLRDGHLWQLTKDQTAAQALVDDGTMTKDQAARSPLSDVLISGIGPGVSTFRPKVSRTTLEPGDRVLLCTDGLTDRVDDATIASLLESAETADAGAHDLVEAAERAGATDDVTAVVSICRPPIERPAG